MKKFPEYQHLNLSEINKEILAEWQENSVFHQSIEIREGNPSFVFYEGPPSANGMPGIHHVMARTIKDVFCRYKTMQGFQVKRKAGWDTHGLPVELGVEKMLGITKEDIGKKISVDEYNAACRAEVMKYTAEWQNLTEKMGYWVDMDDPYITFDNKYIETLWYLLKQLYDKGLLYKGYTIQPYSPAAGTGLSSHELNQPGCYRDVKDLTAVAMFRLKTQDTRHKTQDVLSQISNLKSQIYFLAWTTTPWTLPSNTALCVGANIDYVLVKTQNPYSKEDVNLILAEVLAPSVLAKQEYEILEKFKGADLAGLEYEQLIPFVKPIDTNISVEKNKTDENSAINQFLSKLVSQNWQINKMPVDKNSVAINKNAFERIQKAPKEFVDFISSFSELENDEKNVWLLSYKDFVDDEKNAFAWNEFENQSVEAADNDKELLSEIKEYWNNHIPFLMSVKDGYSYVSICISKENYGKIYSGYEPEYENSSTCIAENLFDFFEKYNKQESTKTPLRQNPPEGDFGGCFRVICGDFVTTEDGTGIVHIAPTFGADDDKVAKQNGIAPMLLLDKNGKRVPMVDLTGKFYNIEDLDADFVKSNVDVDLYKNFSGKFVKDDYYKELPENHLSLDIEICLWLQEKGLLFKKEKHTHNYPHCWRTDKPVLYYPLDSWFIRTTAVKDEMIALNNTINWKPQSTGTGRFGKWLENLNDWNLSRSRYWGTPLPIWRTEDGSEEICIGSLEELFTEIDKSVAAGFMQENPYPNFRVGDYSAENYDVKNLDLHRPYVDNIVLVSQSGKPMKRELDLIDVWFDSGAMPFAQGHWPFENSEKID